MPSANTTYLLLATLVMFAVTYALRGTVFAVFGGSRTPPRLILYIGRVIGPAVIASLVIYCFRNTTPLVWPYGLPETAAALVCILLHIWKRNPLLSIILSTILYMVLVQHFSS
ncbi:MAG: AzlD domain-containing protein [Lentisphaeria bacterium]|nr:AzlD domain-containing protein [Lentisphaeria bacterium]